MKKSIEEKILEQLIDKVIEKDRDIQNRHEDEALKNATFETLQDMTDLSYEEIKAMEKLIRSKMLKKAKRKVKLFIIFGSFVVIVLLIVYLSFNKENFKNELVFTEDFNDNSNGWEVYNDIIFNKYIEDDKYIFTTGENEQCFDHQLELKLPVRFTAEITTTLIKGSQETYGVKLSMGYASKHTFFLHPDNKTYIDPYFTSSGKQWVSFPILTEQGKNTVIQKIIAVPQPRKSVFDMPMGKFKYFVNDKFIEERYYDNPENGSIVLFVCGSQSVSFDHLKIIDDSNGRIFFDGPFSNLKDQLQTRLEYYVMSSIENGRYIFKTDKKGKCYKSTIPYDLKKQSKIKLHSRWLEGETYYYGMLLEADENNFYAFELKSDGTACYIKSVNGESEIFRDNIETGLSDIKNTDVLQTVFLNGENLEYYVNDKLVLNENHTLEGLKSIGFRVCGRQNVAFEKLEVWE